MRILIPLFLLLAGCQTEMVFLPRTPKPTTVYSPPPLFDYVVTITMEPEPPLTDEWVKLWRGMGFTEAEALKRARQMEAIK